MDSNSRQSAVPRPEQGGTERPPSDDWNRKRREILDAAAEVFFRRGFTGGTTKEIAAKVGISQPSIYHYVGSKEDLMVEIARQVARDFTITLNAALGAHDDPVAKLGAVIDSFVASLVLNQRTFAVYWKEYYSLPPAVAQEVSADQRAYVQRFESLVGDVQRAGYLPADQPTRIISEGILGMMSWMHWWYRPGEFDQQQVATAFRALIGLRSS